MAVCRGNDDGALSELGLTMHLLFKPAPAGKQRVGDVVVSLVAVFTEAFEIIRAN